MEKEIDSSSKTYVDYISLQKEKTTDPKKREKWLNQEWDLKLNGFERVFKKNLSVIGKKCLCIGARTGQEVQALINLGKEAIGIDLVPCEPLVIEGDFHNLSFENGSFDFVFSNVFDHALYPDKFLQEISRVLSSRGVAILHLQTGGFNDKYGVHDINEINEDFVAYLPSDLKDVSYSHISYPEFATFDLEALLTKAEYE
jgi:SAM-dependent methyltransferase